MSNERKELACHVMDESEDAAIQLCRDMVVSKGELPLKYWMGKAEKIIAAYDAAKKELLK